MTDNEIEKRLAEIGAEAEDNRDRDDEALFGKGTRPNRGKSQMLSVRLPATVFSELEQVAEKLDVPVSSLVRGYVLRGLSEQTESVEQTVHRLGYEVEKLRRLVGI